MADHLLWFQVRIPLVIFSHANLSIRKEKRALPKQKKSAVDLPMERIATFLAGKVMATGAIADSDPG
jgi:hypothetical protein